MACSSSPRGGGSGGTFDAVVTTEGASTTFAATCDLLESDSFHRGFASTDDSSFEIVWRKRRLRGDRHRQ